MEKMKKLRLLCLNLLTKMMVIYHPTLTCPRTTKTNQHLPSGGRCSEDIHRVRSGSFMPTKTWMTRSSLPFLCWASRADVWNSLFCYLILESLFTLAVLCNHLCTVSLKQTPLIFGACICSFLNILCAIS